MLPGFYEYGAAIDVHSDAVMVAGQAFVVDATDRYLGVTPPLPIADGLVADMPKVIAMQHPLNFAATVVCRQAYERVGGFDSDLVHANDWEMWSRLAVIGPVVGIATPLAFYRRHGGSDSARASSGRAATSATRSLRSTSSWPASTMPRPGARYVGPARSWRAVTRSARRVAISLTAATGSRWRTRCGAGASADVPLGRDRGRHRVPGAVG